MHKTLIPREGYDGIGRITLNNKTYLRGTLTTEQLRTIVAYQEKHPDITQSPHYVSAVISCHISDMIDKDFEQFLDFIATEMCSNDLLMDIDYEIIGLDTTEKNTVYLLVSGDVSGIIDNEE